MTETSRSQRDNTRLGGIRLVFGAIQGAALYVLIRTGRDGGWGDGHPVIYAALWMAALWTPFVLLGGVGALRRTTLATWALAAAVTAAALGGYDVWRQAGEVARLSPTPACWVAVPAILFIAHHLIVCADRQRRVLAPYPAYFDAAWKDGVQLVLSALFVLIFWGVLFLGAALFKAIGLKGFQDLITKEWFICPATTMMFAAAIHLTDVRVSLIRGVRTVVLALLGWLTPLMALIGAAFLLSLPFTGLQPLWRTGHATQVLLGAAAALIILLNAVYQDGAAEGRAPAVLRLSSWLAAVLLTPLLALATYGVALRVGQYGWTPDRVTAVGCIAVGACYAGGYLVAAFRKGRWLAGLERTNVITAFVAIAVLLAVFSPVADPARLSVADQMSRLKDARTPVEKFDFRFLRFESGRFGVAALKRLQADSTRPDVARRAGEALRTSNRWDINAVTPQLLKDQITVYPKGQGLPDAFFRQPRDKAGDWDPCLRAQGEPLCQAFFVDINGDGRREVLLGTRFMLHAYAEKPDGSWSVLGSLAPVDCQVLEALQRGEGRAVTPAWPDIQAGGRQLRLTPIAPRADKPRECAAA